VEKEFEHEQVNDHQKLMKKTLYRLISFFFIMVIAIVLFFLFQDNPLFIFRIGRSPADLSAYGSYHLISSILFTFFAIYVISYILLLTTYIQHVKGHDQGKKIQKRYAFFDFFSVIPIFFVVMMVINGWWVTIAVIDGPSMEPTYYTNDIVMIQYHHDIQTDDIVVFERDKLYIKRVIGLPGDQLVIQDDEIWINGEYVSDAGDFEFNDDDGLIDQGYYFVLGDNRSNSKDSRQMGLIAEEDMVGVVVLDVT